MAKAENTTDPTGFARNRTESLAAEIFVLLVTTTASSSKQISHLATQAFEQATEFWAVADSQKKREN